MCKYDTLRFGIELYIKYILWRNLITSYSILSGGYIQEVKKVKHGRTIVMSG